MKTVLSTILVFFLGLGISLHAREVARAEHVFIINFDQAVPAATALWLLGVSGPEGFWGRPVVSAFAP